MSVHVVHDTKGAGVRALLSRMARLNKRVLVGVPSGKREPDGTSTAMVAAVTEFGTSTEPERSFLRAGIRENLPAFAHLNRQLLTQVVEGRSSEDQALGHLGLAAVAAVKRKMIDGPFVPNAPSTIKAKGSDRPTIDSGNLRQSITHVIEGDGR